MEEVCSMILQIIIIYHTDQYMECKYKLQIDDYI